MEVVAVETAKVIAWVFGAVFVGVYIVLLILQFCHIDAPALEWNRRLELLNPLQSLGFAGAGVLLGTAVQQQATKKAEDEAEKNQKAVNTASEFATRVIVKAEDADAPKVLKRLVPEAEKVKEAGLEQ